MIFGHRNKMLLYNFVVQFLFINGIEKIMGSGKYILFPKCCEILLPAFYHLLSSIIVTE